MTHVNSEDNNSKIYLDYNATTPVAKEVISSITESLINDWGNPSSSHDYGEKSRKSILIARNEIGKMLNREGCEIIFTSGGTESNNMIIYGILQYYKEKQNLIPGISNKKPHIITCNVEHDSVILPIRQLKKLLLADCTVVKVNETGAVDAERIISEIRENTCLITIMSANNETGVVMPVAEIGKRLKLVNKERKVKKMLQILFHTDAAQMIGKEKINADELNVDYITVAGHKFYGPRIGCIWAKGPLYPIFFGGGQESKIRPGTENTPMIIGLGKAAELVNNHIHEYRDRMLKCRTHLEERLKDVFGDEIVFNCNRNRRLPNTLNVSFVGKNLSGVSILSKCERLIASVGSACHNSKCSEILINSGVPVHLARNAIRLSLGRETTLQDIENVVQDLAQAVNNLKK